MSIIHDPDVQNTRKRPRSAVPMAVGISRPQGARFLRGPPLTAQWLPRNHTARAHNDEPTINTNVWVQNKWGKTRGAYPISLGP